MNQSCRERSVPGSYGPSTVYQNTCPTPVASGPERGYNTGRQKAGRQIQTLQNARPGEINIDVVLKNDVDHREAESGRRPDRFDAGQPLQVDRQGIGDLVFDFLRASSRPVGENDHLVFAEVRNRIDGSFQQRPISPTRQQGVGEKDQSTGSSARIRSAY